ncbi:endonuclease YncB(thermonuclease family) [Bartonella fuyuanensis]|uniref:Endonuclease YncB(Thermonuclease family) n=1 Tax=Bartonella fuyuanensis TaxID=1460968 RepID=A0A840E408_9HYPH|nr:thermonuclease family protein [Bartonella fuyuanensis]MBB4076868.1 endonuclease YncB(thermonuclease family) [Bartonella fuyuanensis]
MRFKLIVIIYIMGSIVWGLSQYKDKIDLSVLNIFKMQDVQDIVDHYREEEKFVKSITKQKLEKNKPAPNWQQSVSLNDVAKNAVVFHGRASVTSGVTFKLLTPVAQSWRSHITRDIHLYGVDTCAPRQKARLNNQEWPCGAVSTAWLVTKTLGQDLSCKQVFMHNGIYYAQCFVQEIDLAEAGLTEGMLLLSKEGENSIPTQYHHAEEKARDKRIGLWSSDFIEPLKWRRNNGSYNPFSHP